MTPSRPPKVFISYSWDSDEHCAWVRELATRLRVDGIETILDQWELAPGDQLPVFMEKSVRESDFILIVCTPKYKQRSDGRRGGVGYEGDVMTAEVFNGSQRRKFIPVLRHTEWIESAPSWLAGSIYIDMGADLDRSDRYRELADTLHSRREKAPPIGRAPEPMSLLARGTMSGPQPKRTIDGISEDAQRIIDDRERNPDSWEIRLFSQVLADELKSASSLKRELVMGVSFGPYEYLEDHEAIAWMRRQMGEVSSIASGMVQLVNDGLKKAMGPPGVPGDPDAIVFIAIGVVTAYRRAIEWTIRWRTIRVSEHFQRLAELGPRWTANMIPQVEEWSERMRRKIAETVARPRDPANPVVVDLSTTIDIPDGVEEQFMSELEKVRAALIP